jgi:hypothetical protein
MMKRLISLAIVALVLAGCAQAAPAPQQQSAGDQALASAFSGQRSGEQVTGSGVVSRILSDDTDGGRHQRFILTLASGQTLLIAHNIDIAPRVASLRLGDTVEFDGVYEWNAQGGVVHWAHHDPTGTHQPGWLRHAGRTYQ